MSAGRDHEAVPGERARRRAARELIGAYHDQQLRGLLERVRGGFARLDSGEIDAFELDELIHRYKRSARELWKFCGSRLSVVQRAPARRLTAPTPSHGEASGREAITIAPRPQVNFGGTWDTRCVRRAIWVLSAVVAVGLLLIAASGSAAPASTKVVYVAPVDTSGKLLASDIILLSTKGTCGPGSDSVPGPVYRCFNDDSSILDPCWAVKRGLLFQPDPHHRAVLCMQFPWSRIVVRVDSTIPLSPPTQTVPRSTAYPWGVQLANGENCLAAQGAHSGFRGRVIDYGCGSSGRIELLSGMHQKTQPWTFDSAIWNGKSLKPGPAESVRVAWYGGPWP